MKLTDSKKASVIIKAAVVYFAIVFGAGFVLGPLRILFIVPRFGARIAELIETPIMLLVIVFAAKWVVHKFRLAGSAMTVGILALVFMIAFEFTLVLWLRGIALTEYFRQRDPVAGVVYYSMLIVFAVMPLLITNRAKHRHDSLYR